MFFIIPVGVEYKADRMPVVTFTLMGINTAIHLVMMALFFTNETAYIRAFDLFTLVPAVSAWHTYLTSCFLHADIFHLLGNMVYLFLFGSCVEDIVGRGRFLVMYLVAGILAGLAHMATGPSSDIPTLGASGAISACMGAFVLLLHKRQIEFKYVFLFFFRLFAGDFFLPAWLVITFWFGTDVLGAILNAGSEMGGIAYGAHIGGFLAGMAAVPPLKALMKRTKAREQAAAEAAEAEATWRPTIPSDAQISILDNEQQYGPYSLPELWGAYQEGHFTEEALYWHEGLEDWRELRDVF